MSICDSINNRRVIDFDYDERRAGEWQIARWECGFESSFDESYTCGMRDGDIDSHILER